MVAAQGHFIDQQTRNVLLRLIGRIAPTWLDCDDLAQTATIKLLLGATTPPWGDPLLRRVAHSVVIDALRLHKRRSEGQLGASKDFFLSTTPEVQFQGTEIANAISKCLQQLPPERRTAVALYLQEYRIPEIAAELGWTRKKASNAVYRGLQDLRDQYDIKILLPASDQRFDRTNSANLR